MSTRAPRPTLNPLRYLPGRERPCGRIGWPSSRSSRPSCALRLCFVGGPAGRGEACGEGAPRGRSPPALAMAPQPQTPSQATNCSMTLEDVPTNYIRKHGGLDKNGGTCADEVWKKDGLSPASRIARAQYGFKKESGWTSYMGQELFGRELDQRVHDDRAVLREKLLGSVPQGIHVDGTGIVRS